VRFDLADYAAREIRAAVEAGYVMREAFRMTPR